MECLVAISVMQTKRLNLYSTAWRLGMGRPSAKVLKTRMWRKADLMVKRGENQDHCCDRDVAHPPEKSHQPIVRVGKVGVSRLPEEDHHRCARGRPLWQFDFEKGIN